MVPKNQKIFAMPRSNFKDKKKIRGLIFLIVIVKSIIKLRFTQNNIAFSLKPKSPISGAPKTRANETKFLLKNHGP